MFVGLLLGSQGSDTLEITTVKMSEQNLKAWVLFQPLPYILHLVCLKTEQNNNKNIPKIKTKTLPLSHKIKIIQPCTY